MNADNDGTDNIDDNDDSIVVQEYDVILRASQPPTTPPTSAAKDAAALHRPHQHNLCVLQYPGHPIQQQQQQRSRNNDDDRPPVSARIKPRHHMLEMEHHHHHHAATSSVDNNTANTRTYVSQTIPISTHLCLGRLVGNNNLELRPVTHLFQMRPSFAHLDDKNNTAEVTQQNDSNESEEQYNNRNNNNNNNRPVTFQRKESERAAAIRKSSYAFQKASQEAEAWIDLTIMDDGDDDILRDAPIVPGASGSSTNNTDLVLPILSNHPPPTAAATASVKLEEGITTNPPVKMNDARTYVQSLNYLQSKEEEEDHHHQDTILHMLGGGSNTSQQQQSRLLVAKELTRILAATGGPVPHAVLRTSPLLSDDAPTRMTGLSSSHHQTSIILDILNTVAVNCRGNWCLHSKFLVKTLSPWQQKLRTFVLLVLQRHGILTKRQLHRAFFPNHHPEHNSNDVERRDEDGVVNAVLRMVATKEQNTTNGTQGMWKLKIGDDDRFLQEHPEIVELHETYWKRQMEVRFVEEWERYHHQE